MANRFVLNETSYHGKGAIESIPVEAKARGFKKALVCSDPDLVKFGVTAKVTDLLDKAGLAYELYSNIKPNPTIENVQQGVKALHDAGADYMIAIGGGSSMDTAKAVGIIDKNPEFADVRSLEGVAPTKNPCTPIFAVPTTAGTAAEVTINYVITDAEKNRKMVCVDPHDIPVVAFIDPEMMASMPKGLTAATGMGALYDTPHGIANAIILPTVMEYNAEATGEKYREIARAMGVKGVDDMTQEEYRKAAVDAVKQLSQDVGIPGDLKDIVKREDIPFLAQSAYDDACRPGNPKETSVEDITKLYESLL